MLVRVKDQKETEAWIFVKPWKRELWIASFAFFVFTGFVVWMIEHRVNPAFRGEPAEQFGTSFYFAFSTLVFSHSSVSHPFASPVNIFYSAGDDIS